MTRRKPLKTGNAIGAMTPVGWHTRKSAARKVDRDPDTLKSWHRKGLVDEAYAVCVPSGSMPAGQLTVHLYSDDDVEKLKKFAAAQRPGLKAELQEAIGE